MISSRERVQYFEKCVERALEKLTAKPDSFIAQRRYTYAIRCHDEALSGKPWVLQPEPDNEDNEEGALER